MCAGWEAAPRDKGVRCIGFESTDRQYIHCSREERAGDIRMTPGSETFAHRASGPCKCGVTHGVSDKAPHFVDKPPRLVDEYIYHTADGETSYKVLRYEPKAFKQMHWTGTDWRWGLGGKEPLLYGLPAIIDAVADGETIFICEGEKDVDALRAAGQVATCNSGGAGKFPASMAIHLQHADVVIVADKDEPGRAHAADVATKLGLSPNSLRIVQARTGKDAADHLAAGHGVDEFLPVAGEPDAEVELDNSIGLEVLSVASWFDSEPKPIDWLIKGLALDAEPGMLVAPGGTGKGHFCIQMALSLATGENFGPFEVPRRRGVLWVSREDRAHILHRRMLDGIAACWPHEIGHVRKEQIAESFGPIDAVGKPTAYIGEALFDWLRRAADRVKDCGLIILDPLSKMLPQVEDFDLNSVRGAQEIFKHIDKFITETGISVMPVHHTSKAAERAGQLLKAHSATGSKQLTDQSRWNVNMQEVNETQLAELGLDHGWYVQIDRPKNNHDAPSRKSFILRRSGGGALVWVDAKSRDESDLERALAVLRSDGPMTREEHEKACNGLDPKIPINRTRAARTVMQAKGLIRAVGGSGSGQGSGRSKVRYEAI